MRELFFTMPLDKLEFQWINVRRKKKTETYHQVTTSVINIANKDPLIDAKISRWKFGGEIALHHFKVSPQGSYQLTRGKITLWWTNLADINLTGWSR